MLFVTTELPPALPGGAGNVIDNLATLLNEAGRDVTVLLCSPTPPNIAPKPYRLEHLLHPSPTTLEDFVHQSERIAQRVVELDPERVEFHDFNIPGFWTLSNRSELGLTSTPIAVRFHGPVNEILKAVGGGPEHLQAVAQLETHCLAMADYVIVPSAAMSRYVSRQYATDSIKIGALPIQPLTSATYQPPAEPHFVFYGRTNEVKGPDVFVSAIEQTGYRGTFVGPDGWSLLRNQPMSEILGDAAEHYGPVERDDLAPFSSATAVVIPSRFESFCLAAYEARAKGLPIIVADLPAFEDLWDASTGALTFDGSANGLVNEMRQLATQPDLAIQLATAPLPRLDDPLHIYDQAWNARHPQSQAGLATAAMSARNALTSNAPRRPIQRAMKLIPAPAAAIAARVLPQWAKDRFRGLADWNVEAGARAATARRADFQRNIAEVCST